MSQGTRAGTQPVTQDAPAGVDPPPGPTSWPSRARSATAWLPGAARWAGALLAGLVVFSAFVAANGADPLAVLADIWTSTLTQPGQFQQIVLRAAPIALAGLAVVVPARAGLVNVGGEGQIVVGGIAAAGAAMWLTPFSSVGGVLAGMVVAAALAGAAWAGIAAALRLVVQVNEAVTTLLLNYVALYSMLFLILGPWKDPAALGQSTSVELVDSVKLPVFSGTSIHVGVVLAVVAAAAVWFALTRTSWGFRLTVVGGNAEAARRAGLPVVRLLLTALLIGGALAGLAGFLQLAGMEYKLRPTFGLTIGYVAFLASWLARHKPLPLLLTSFVLAAIAVSGNSLQIGSGLPAASVNILMGLLLVTVLGWTSARKERA
ncbi:ABC transporter permease [Cellulomonas phragmiteti]|uniref:ABC transporter permease n=1 Tax=Cellulomonas phragmiteti TaxID=478780 RepID=A0ABQ4DID5_9CELL|nr:ABC transporter permease [Cellulomonas phragmiteti]GIG39109.1 ABC transporter permease [Cellulomonas phragmiteti]